ncbi:sugar nucleotide-binding protein [Microbacterium sp. Se63.02b]|uniref:sugar nucleotide-binding protein n=1 Tax=Microbacterium sp. Se63.02b TaxID=2709304 RepID=UPI001FCEE9B3|nr:sugar nucleotide-binding protein [Microbacterium sp. Se63.02b]
MNASSAPVPRRTLLVGSGKLAARLAPRLIDSGGEVFALRRSEGPLPEGVSGIRADLSLPPIPPLPTVDAMVITLPPSGEVTGYRTALTHLAAALARVPARTVFVSSTGVFDGAGSKHPLTERDEPAPTTDRSRGLRDGERAAIELFDAVVVRPAGIYGPGRDFLVRRVREGAAVDHARRTNRIHETDLVRVLDVLLRMDAPPRLVHAVDEDPAPLGEVVRFIAARMGWTCRPRSTPTVRPGSSTTGRCFTRCSARSSIRPMRRDTRR